MSLSRRSNITLVGLCLSDNDVLSPCLLTQDWFDSSPPNKNGRHFPDDIFKCIFMNETFCILIRISLKFVPKGAINNIPALVQIMGWRRTGAKPLSEAMLTQFIDAYIYICGARGRWVNTLAPDDTMWRHRTWSASVQLMACCPTAPSHYLNQRSLIMGKVRGILLRAIS